MDCPVCAYAGEFEPPPLAPLNGVRTLARGRIRREAWDFLYPGGEGHKKGPSRRPMGRGRLVYKYVSIFCGGLHSALCSRSRETRGWMQSEGRKKRSFHNGRRIRRIVMGQQIGAGISNGVVSPAFLIRGVLPEDYKTWGCSRPLGMLTPPP